MVLASQELLAEFFGSHTVAAVAPFGNGHINDTFLVRLDDGQEAVVQRINDHVFRDPARLMSNVERVCLHLGLKYAGRVDRGQRHMSIWPTTGGRPYFQDSSGKYWRVYHRVAGVTSFDKINHPSQAFQVGKAFAEFQALLSDLPAPRLFETIPDFHHTPRRLERFKSALEADAHNRASHARQEIAFIEKRQDKVSRLIDLQTAGLLPERITHNDTKLNNLLFDKTGSSALCVVDLDTVMPGLVHYDFGDMVRTATCLRDEDEKDVRSIEADRETFRQLALGYLEGGTDFLTAAEVQELVFSGILMTFEVGLRFLTDYLEGDHYFKTSYGDHNWVRCCAQFALVRSLERQQQEWEDIVASAQASKTQGAI